jgi:hypothetical protein
MPLWIMRNMFKFSRWGVVSTSPTPKLEDHPLLAVRDRLFNIFAATLRIWRPFLHPQPEDAPCRGDRDPLTTVPCRGDRDPLTTVPCRGDRDPLTTVPCRGDRDPLTTVPCSCDRDPLTTVPCRGDRDPLTTVPCHCDRDPLTTVPCRGDRDPFTTVPCHGDRDPFTTVPCRGDRDPLTTGLDTTVKKIRKSWLPEIKHRSHSLSDLPSGYKVHRWRNRRRRKLQKCIFHTQVRLCLGTVLCGRKPSLRVVIGTSKIVNYGRHWEKYHTLILLIDWAT